MLTQITPRDEAAAYHLNDTKDDQRRAMRLAMTLIDELPFTATDMHIIRLRPQLQWGVRLHVLREDSAVFDEVAVELGAKREMKMETVGGSSVSRTEVLAGVLHGIPFEIRAFMGTQLVAVA